MLKGSELLAFDNTTCKIIQGEEIIFTAKISEMPNYVEEIEKTIKTDNGWYIYECVTARRFRNRGYFKIALAHIGRKAGFWERQLTYAAWRQICLRNKLLSRWVL